MFIEARNTFELFQTGTHPQKSSLVALWFFPENLTHHLRTFELTVFLYSKWNAPSSPNSCRVQNEAPLGELEPYWNASGPQSPHSRGHEHTSPNPVPLAEPRPIAFRSALPCATLAAPGVLRTSLSQRHLVALPYPLDGGAPAHNLV